MHNAFKVFFFSYSALELCFKYAFALDFEGHLPLSCLLLLLTVIIMPNLLMETYTQHRSVIKPPTFIISKEKTICQIDNRVFVALHVHVLV